MVSKTLSFGVMVAWARQARRLVLLRRRGAGNGL